MLNISHLSSLGLVTSSGTALKCKEKRVFLWLFICIEVTHDWLLKWLCWWWWKYIKLYIFRPKDSTIESVFCFRLKFIVMHSVMSIFHIFMVGRRKSFLWSTHSLFIIYNFSEGFGLSWCWSFDTSQHDRHDMTRWQTNFFRIDFLFLFLLLEAIKTLIIICTWKSLVCLKNPMKFLVNLHWIKP